MQTYEIDDLATLRNVVTALIHAYKGNGIDPATVKTTPLTLYVRNSAILCESFDDDVRVALRRGNVR
jgi:hypothetical protein